MEDSGTGCGMVVFLIPDGYRHLSELTSCLQEARKGLSNSEIEIMPEPITWESFVKNLELQDVAAQNELIREFYHHLSKRFESVSFSREEIMQLGKSSAMPMHKLVKVVEKTFRHVKQSVSASRTLIVDEGGEAVGFSFGPGKQCLWFGIWFRYWDWEDGSPLCLAAYRRNASKGTLHAFCKLGAVHTLDDHLVKGYRPIADQDSSVLIQEIIEDAEILLEAESQEA